jgi:multidrug efflux pump subunit AcrB
MELGIPVKKATEQAMREISGAIIAITLVMSAVFYRLLLWKDLPVYFIASSLSPWHFQLYSQVSQH